MMTQAGLGPEGRRDREVVRERYRSAGSSPIAPNHPPDLRKPLNAPVSRSGRGCGLPITDVRQRSTRTGVRCSDHPICDGFGPVCWSASAMPHLTLTTVELDCLRTRLGIGAAFSAQSTPGLRMVGTA